MVNDSRRENPNVDEIALAALWHDIGKFYQRAQHSKDRMPKEVLNRASVILPTSKQKGNYTHWHALWSDSFFTELVDKNPFPKDLDRRWVRDCAVFHHAPNNAFPKTSIAWIIALADRAAAGMERKEKDIEEDSDASGMGKQSYRKTNLTNIFSKINNISNNNLEKTRYEFQKLSVFAPENLAPTYTSKYDDKMHHKYHEMWEEFLSEYKDMAEKCWVNINVFYDGIIGILEKYTWAIPSSTIDEPDVSLFDHAMATSAVASCLFLYHEYYGSLDNKESIVENNTPKLRFIVGDLSGIQKSLFTLASEGASGLPKLLRGRSLRMQLIVQAAAKRILKEMKLPPTCILQNAGGRFVILAPFTNDEEQNALIDSLRCEFDEFLRSQYQGDLILNIGFSEAFSVNDLISSNKSNATMALITYTADATKLNPLRGARDPIWKVKWNKDLGICRSCGKRPAVKNSEQPQCYACYAETELGRKYPKSKALIIDNNNKFKSCDNLYGYNIDLIDDLNGDDALSGWQFNYKTSSVFPFGKKFTRAYVPVHTTETIADDVLKKVRIDNNEDNVKIGDLITFEELAAKSTGVKLLATFKADVDRLGQIFSKGLGDKRSLARVASLSRMMDAFFNGKLPEILSNDFPYIYTVYAGGDDLLLLGPWNDVLDLACRLNDEFHAHTGNNPNITISAGISLFQPNTPLTLAALEAEERLELAKNPKNKEITGRNRIHVFNNINEDALLWSEFSEVMKNGKILDSYIKRDLISTSLLHKLLVLDEQRQKSKTNPNYADWKSKLGYLLWRLYPDKGAKIEFNKEIRGFILEMMGISTNFNSEKYKPSARASIAYAIYLNRQG